MMLNRKQIVEAVKTIKAALGKDNDYYVNDGYIIAQNSESIAKVKVDGLKDNFRLPSKAIPLISAMGEEIEVKITDENISFKSGKSKANYKITSIPEELLSADNFKSKYNITINADIINNAIHKLFNLIATSNSRPVLTGLNMQIRDNSIIFTASDGYRVARYKEDIASEETFSCIIPRNALSIISTMNFKEDIVLGVNDCWITITDKSETKTINSRIIDGDYLNVDTFFSGVQALQWKINKDEIIAAIDRTRLVAGNLAKVNVTLKDDITIEYADINEYSETLNVIESCNETADKTVNLNYLKDAVAALFEDSIDLYTNVGAKTPFIFRDKKVESLLLPINKN